MNLSQNQKKSLRNHCDSVLSKQFKQDNETTEQFLKICAYAACRKSQLARGKFTADERTAVEFCIDYMKKQYDTSVF